MKDFVKPETLEEVWANRNASDGNVRQKIDFMFRVFAEQDRALLEEVKQLRERLAALETGKEKP